MNKMYNPDVFNREFPVPCLPPPLVGSNPPPLPLYRCGSICLMIVQSRVAWGSKYLIPSALINSEELVSLPPHSFTSFFYCSFRAHSFIKIMIIAILS